MVSFLQETRVRRLLSASEAAAELGVKTSTVRRWVASGDLPAVRLGNGPLARIRVQREALETFVPGERRAERGQQ